MGLPNFDIVRRPWRASPTWVAVSNHEAAPKYRNLEPSSFETRYALLRMRDLGLAHIRRCAPRVHHHIGSLVGRWYLYHRAIIIRVIVTAVTIEVRMPRPMETAKPRTGPAPRK